MTDPKTRVVINNPLPKILPTAINTPYSSSPVAIIAVMTSGAPLAKAINVILI